MHSPSIETIALAGFAPQAINLNQTLRTITIVPPASLTDLKLKATVALTPNTEIIDGLLPDGTLDLSDYCPCTKVGITAIGQLAQTIRLRNTVDQGIGTYQVLLKNEKPLVLKSATEPIETSFASPSVIFLPAENYYGSPVVYGVSLAEKGANEYTFMQADGGCMSVCDKSGQHLNEVGISLDAYTPFHLKPGQYDLRLKLDGGIIVKYPQPITIK